MQESPELDSIHVVVGIVKNTKNEVLVSRRRHDVHLGGLLEFPGGKLGENETPKIALERELKEELGINVLRCLPFIQIPFLYPGRSVFLDTYVISEYSGSITANESQQFDWKEISTLNSSDFPDANHGIIRALQLPRFIAVTPNLSHDFCGFLQRFENVVARNDISIIQLRSHELNDSKYIKLAKKCLKLCDQSQTKLILNRKAATLDKLNAAGLHLTSERLLATRKRSLGKDYLIGASCHNFDEVQHASKIGLDYIFIGPVLEKNLAVNVLPLTWSNFGALTQKSLIPAYAIGGLAATDADTSIQYGGQGIAATRNLWGAE